ncbi:MAG: peptidase T [Chloroflexales bacterium]|nr:peptidase T [Chloroflexales bacterium]
MPIAMIVHGGAWAIPDEQVEPHLAGCRAALAAGWAVLEAGGLAPDACEAAVRVMEDAPIFDAGTGSVLTSAGTVELDAAMMDGRTLRYGAVANLRRVRNPITLARRIMDGPGTFLAGEGAEQFALAVGLPLCENDALVVERERGLWEAWRAGQVAAPQYGAPVGSQGPDQQPSAHAVGGRDTVGAIALDSSGNLVVANSTGGTPFKLPGRIGDTPMVGCGLYADDFTGGAVCSGWGESIVRVALARRAVELLERGLPPQSAAEVAIRNLARRVSGGSGGCIILTPAGRIGLAWNTRRIAYAYRQEGGEPTWGC